ILPAHQIETVAIAEMIVGPAFLVRVLISAEHKQRDVRILGNSDRFGNQFLIVRRIAEMSAISKPDATLFGYFATLGVRDFNFVADLIFDSLQHTDAASGLIAVTTEMDLRRIG